MIQWKDVTKFDKELKCNVPFFIGIDSDTNQTILTVKLDVLSGKWFGDSTIFRTYYKLEADCTDIEAAKTEILRLVNSEGYRLLDKLNDLFKIQIGRK